MLLPSGKHSHPGFCREIPETFKSLEEARNSLDYQWNLCQQKAVDFEYRDTLMQGDELELHREAYDVLRKYYMASMKKWWNAFQSYFDINVAGMDSKALQGARVLEGYGHVIGMHLDISAFSLLHYQTCWDEKQPVFERILELATVVINGRTAADERLGEKPLFQMDQGVIGPLFTVAHKCRDPFVRRRAIALLYSSPLQEGVWDSILTARVAQRIMNLEEKGLGEVKCAADVPDRARISDVGVQFDLMARRGYITFSRLRSLDSHVREPVSDVIEW